MKRILILACLLLVRLQPVWRAASTGSSWPDSLY